MVKNIAYISMYTSAITGLVYLYKYKHTYLIYFLMLLWFNILTEFIGKKYGTPNYIVYNIHHLIKFSALLFFYRIIIKKIVFKKWITFFIIIYLISFFINIYFQDYFTEIQTVPYIIGAFFVIISTFFYFLEVLNTNKIFNISQYLLFWISIGLLIYYAGKLPTRIIKNYWDQVTYYKVILLTDQVILIIMNLCFIIGFIFSKKNKQY